MMNCLAPTVEEQDIKQHKVPIGHQVCVHEVASQFIQNTNMLSIHGFIDFGMPKIPKVKPNAPTDKSIISTGMASIRPGAQSENNTPKIFEYQAPFQCPIDSLICEFVRMLGVMNAACNSHRARVVIQFRQNQF